MGCYVVSSGHVSSGITTYWIDSMYVSGGGVADATKMVGGYLYVSSGGVANDTNLASSGYIYVHNGGVANSTTINGSGSIYVQEGGTANATLMHSGCMRVYFGGTAISTTVNNRGSMFVSGGASALAIMENGGYVEVAEGASATFAANVLSGLNFSWLATLHSGTVATSAIVDNNGNLNVCNGGIVKDITVNGGGNLNISSGGTALNVVWTPCVGTVYSANGAIVTFASNHRGVYFGSANTLLYSATRATSLVLSGHTAYVMSGGTTNSTTIDCGEMYVIGGTANYTALNVDNFYAGNGNLYIQDGGVANFITMHGNINHDANLHIYSGGTANNISASNYDAFVYVEYGGVANDTTAERMFVFSGGVASNINVDRLNVSSGGKVTGVFTLRGTMSAYVGSIIDFDISTVASGNSALLNNWSLVSGNPDYTITVSATQAEGQYVLADCSKGFYNMLTVSYDTGMTIGTIAIGEDLVSGRYTYSIGNGDNKLILTVSGCTPAVETPTAVASTTAPTNQNVTITATFSEDSVQKQYSLNGHSWQDYTSGVVLSANGTVYFRGINEAGNISEIAVYEVSNIDKVAPVKPSASADIAIPTNQDVTVTAIFSDDSAVTQYSLDGSSWNAYTAGVVLSANGTINFRGIDEAGNVSDVTVYKVTNIDKAAPSAPTVAANSTAPTNQDVTVTATFSDDSAVKQYSLDGSSWNAYTTDIVMVANGTVYFRSIDEAGNVSDVTSYTVSNIDKAVPVKPTAMANTTAPTNQDVTVIAVFSDDSVTKQYSLNGETWYGYVDGVVRPANGTVYFRGIDAAGNVSEVTEYEVSNIDKAAPSAPTAAASSTAPTNLNVTVTAVFDEDSAVREYSIDGEDWQAYTTGVVMPANGTVYFRGIDVAGNVSEVTEFVVGNIDRDAPIAPNAAADITDITNQDVTVTAAFSEDSAVKEYSLDCETWRDYTDGVVMPENGKVYFRGIDAAGNVSNVTEYEVSNIDKVAPVAPVADADIKNITNLDVTVSAVFSEDSVTKQYSLDGKTWRDYTTGVIMVENGKVYFRGIDAVGNASEVAEYAVNNIYKIAPDKPVAVADIAAPTNRDVTVTALFGEDSVVKEYSLDGETWQAYTTGVLFTDNGTVYFRSIDAIGNVSEVTSYEVANIDRTAPDKPTAAANTADPTNKAVTVSAAYSGDSAQKQYSLDGETWFVYTSGVVMSDNGTVYFRGIDAAGNISDVTEFEVTNIDKVAPVAPVADADIKNITNRDVTVTAAFSDDSVTKQYSLDGKTWRDYTTGVVMSDNGTVYFWGIDVAGNVSDVTEYTVTNIDKVAPAKPVAIADIAAPTTQNVTVAAVFGEDSVINEYSLDGETWQEYTTGVLFTDNGTAYFRSIDAIGNVSDVTSYEVANIDRTAPDKPTAAANTADPTNKAVTVSAAYSGDSAQKQYSLDGETWFVYTSGVVMSDNGTVYFRGIDAAGNISDVTDYTVDNIDKLAPNAPTVEADNIELTNRNITLTATFSSDSAQKQYSTDNHSWNTYSAALSVGKNGTYYFRGIDAAGNISDVTSYAVINIDKEAPVAPTATADITDITNHDVTVTAVFSDDSMTKQYSFDNSTWQDYTAGVVMSSNGTVYFRAMDAIGNISNVTSYTVRNIDKTKLVAPVVTASTTDATNKNVTLTITFSSDGVKKQYSTDNTSWKTCADTMSVGKNGTYYFRSIDAAGRISGVTSYEVDNIDKDAPNAPTATASTVDVTNQDVTVSAVFSDDSMTKQYSFDNSTWQDYTAGVVMSANGTVYFRGIDKAGNVSAVTPYNVTNIDKVAPTLSLSTTAPTNKSITLTATFTKDAAKKQYSTDNKTWSTYSKALTVEKNGTYYFRGVDKNGKVSRVVTLKVTNIDKVAPNAPKLKASTTKLTNQNVTVTATFSTDSVKKQYSTDNKTWKTYSKALAATKNGTYYFRGIDAAGNASKVASIKVANIDKTAPTAPKLTASTTKATGKSITITATFSKDSAKKQYSTDNKTWKTYSKALSVKANGTYYFRGVDAAGNASKVASVKVANIVDTTNNKWDKATVLKGTVLGALEAKADSVDYYNVGDVAKLMLDMEKGKAKVSFYDKNKKAVKVSSLTMANGSAKKKVSSLTLVTGNGTTDHFTIAALDDAVKYLKIETADKTIDSYKLAKLA